MSINLRQLVAVSLGSILLPMGFIDPAGAEVSEADLLNTSSGIAHFGSTHRDSFTDLLEFNLSSMSTITVTVTALNSFPQYDLDELEVALFTEASSRKPSRQDDNRHGDEDNRYDNKDKKDTDKLGTMLYSSSGLSQTFSFEQLSAGDYFLRITGEPEAIGKKNKFLGGTYSGSLSVTAYSPPAPPVTPVAEPEVWATMLAGLALLGHWQRRRFTVTALPA